MRFLRSLFKLPKLLSFLAYYLWEVILSNIEVACEVLTPRHNMKPGIIAVPLDLDDDRAINALANLITMTPGTMSIDVSPDKKVLYVYSLNVSTPEEFKHRIKTKLERKVMDLFC